MTPRILPILAALATLTSSGCSLIHKKSTAATPAVSYSARPVGHEGARLKCVYRTPEDAPHVTFWAKKKHNAATCDKPLPVGAHAVKIPTSSFADYDIHFTTVHWWDIPPPDQTVRVLNNQLTTVTIYYQ